MPRGGPAPLNPGLRAADMRGMRHVPTWLKLVALASLIAEAFAAAALFWHAGPRHR